MNQLWSVGNIRDYWARFNPAMIENLSWLDAPDCFQPRIFGAPNEAQMAVSASGYVITTHALVPGSWIIGLVEANAESLDFQVTDLNANFKFFSAPVSAAMIASTGGYASPFWLPEPYMVIGPAAVRVEIWNNTAAATANSQISLLVLQPTEV